MASAAGNIPINSVYGPYEGGLRCVGDTTTDPAKKLPFVIAAFNVQDALGNAGGSAAQEERSLALATMLQTSGVVVAVLSEPRLSPGVQWTASPASDT